MVQHCAALHIVIFTLLTDCKLSITGLSSAQCLCKAPLLIEARVAFAMRCKVYSTVWSIGKSNEQWLQVWQLLRMMGSQGPALGSSMCWHGLVLPCSLQLCSTNKAPCLTRWVVCLCPAAHIHCKCTQCMAHESFVQSRGLMEIYT